MRPDGPHLRVVRPLVDRIFGSAGRSSVERVAEGVSTYVYRVCRGSETFYLRVWPEEGESFAPEARALTLLRERGVRVPRVLFLDACDETLQRSVMLTSEIPGRHLGHGPADPPTRRVLNEAGRDLALINEVPVDGFGWIRRDPGVGTELQGEHPTFRDFALEHLDRDLAALTGRALSRADTASIRAIVEAHPGWLIAERASLAHGDFDATAIHQQDGRYTGIIDFGEIRGTDVWYDLGHVRMHDGETVSVPLLDWLVEGYRSVTPLSADYRQRIAFASLTIAVRALARCLERRPAQVASHQSLTSIPRDLAVLRP
jgi:aminoglycoside phosphotransferase (APT) family kinase protein